MSENVRSAATGCVACECVADRQVILCDECDAVWSSPDPADRVSATSDPSCDVCGQSLWGEQAHWATQSEIEAADWWPRVSGEDARRFPHRDVSQQPDAAASWDDGIVRWKRIAGADSGALAGRSGRGGVCSALRSASHLCAHFLCRFCHSTHSTALCSFAIQAALDPAGQFSRVICAGRCCLGVQDVRRLVLKGICLCRTRSTAMS